MCWIITTCMLVCRGHPLSLTTVVFLGILECLKIWYGYGSTCIWFFTQSKCCVIAFSRGAFGQIERNDAQSDLRHQTTFLTEFDQIKRPHLVKSSEMTRNLIFDIKQQFWQSLTKLNARIWSNWAKWRANWSSTSNNIFDRVWPN